MDGEERWAEAWLPDTGNPDMGDSPLPPSFRPVVALAGRRIDAAGADQERFPLRRREAVLALLEAELEARGAQVMVSSAACGADLLGLEAARALGMRRIIILPFDPGLFREKSVIDRPGDWAGIFDELVGAAAAVNDLIQLDLPEDEQAYRTATRKIVDVAKAEANARRAQPFLALQVWDGASRGEGDYTAEFGHLALAAGGEIQVIPTLK
jgi:hypothetical protein